MSEKQVTYRQIEEQHASGHNATVLVERSGGKGISVGTYKGESKEHPGYYEVSVDNGAGLKYVSPDRLNDASQAELAERLAGTTTIRRGIGSNALKASEYDAMIAPRAEADHNTPSASAMQYLREQVEASDAAAGVVPARAVAESKPSANGMEEQLKQITEGLSAEDIRYLDLFASYTQDKALAQKEGDGQGSIRSGQYAGQVKLEMSPAAQSIASRYANLWIKLNPID